MFPRIHPLGVDDSSSLGNEKSRQPTWPSNSENSSSFFVIKNCPGATVLTNPASVHQSDQWSSGLLSKSADFIRTSVFLSIAQVLSERNGRFPVSLHMSATAPGFHGRF